ncbi:hypothetical protein [Blastococcus haudaquaticus]|uniref:Uncharacterized protein n=1 Tax=Blastococcus haudaquaticus TaxID=1938745 RepID=A0A286GZ22_9ACTN|nr:hypothetical protein [Blastococcus haudaquaticus]SOE00349.1 hypothetical protein SAMN06272739_2547 [Blastococcus haudaquaticus]
MGKLAAVLLTVLVIVELILIVGIAGALFWVGATGTIVAAAAMLVVALVAGVVALRAMRARQ